MCEQVRFGKAYGSSFIISSFRNTREDALRGRKCNNLGDGGDQGFRNTPQNAVTERVSGILADFRLLIGWHRLIPRMYM